jgi:hypothetical protein
MIQHMLWQAETKREKGERVIYDWQLRLLHAENEIIQDALRSTLQEFGPTFDF